MDLIFIKEIKMYDLKILYVEDNQNVRESLGEYLKEVSKNVYFAKDGKEALEVFEDDTDLVISDIAMPNMNGLELSKELLKNHKIPIILTTAYNENKYLLEAINLGISYYLLKPINLKKLNEILNKIATQKEKDEKLIQYQKELKELNEKLEEKVKDEIEKNKQKDAMLFTQSKQAQMGEMLSMIAHQWRQPLNVISTSAININIKQQLGILSDEDIKKHTETVEFQTQNMSKTIDSFMNFFKPENEKSNFCLYDLIEEMSYIINAQLKQKGIELELVGEKIEIQSYRNELTQVLLNLVSNAKDAFEEKNIENKKITISVEKRENKIEIKVKDNAGGIDEKYLDRIFNPYFTTKEQGKGTGIGLYMSRRIVREVLNGEIYASNIGDGAEFKIVFES